MIVGGYTLHLYCDVPGCAGTFDGGEYYGNTKGRAFREARSAGWRFRGRGADKTAVCLACRRKARSAK